MAIINGKYYPDGNASSAINLLLESNADLLAALEACAYVLQGQLQIIGDDEINDSFQAEAGALKQALAAIAKAKAKG